MDIIILTVYLANVMAITWIADDYFKAVVTRRSPYTDEQMMAITEALLDLDK